jgi:hypothetical protein
MFAGLQLVQLRLGLYCSPDWCSRSRVRCCGSIVPARMILHLWLGTIWASSKPTGALGHGLRIGYQWPSGSITAHDFAPAQRSAAWRPRLNSCSASAEKLAALAICVLWSTTARDDTQIAHGARGRVRCVSACGRCCCCSAWLAVTLALRHWHGRLALQGASCGVSCIYRLLRRQYVASGWSRSATLRPRS